MNNLIIRDALEKDLDELSVLRHYVWETTYRGIYEDSVIDMFDYEHVKKSFNDKIKNTDIIFKVAVIDDKIAGYICFGKNIGDSKYKDYDYLIHYIHISKDYQGHGLGTKFFNLVSSYARENKIDRFYVVCNKYNYAAHKYYEKMGGKKDYESDDIGPKQDQHVVYVYEVGDV